MYLDMKTTTYLLALLLFSLTLYGQGKAPAWINGSSREMEYPASSYYTGFAAAAIGSGESVETATERSTRIAKGELAEKIRVKIASQKTLESQSIGTGKGEQLREKFTSATSTEAQAEIVGVKVQTYYDKSGKKVYAFAYASRRELASYYKSNMSINIGQIESLMKTAQDLEASGEKAKARRQLEAAKPIFAKVRYAQDLLTAVNVNATPADLQQQKIENLYNQLVQMQARLAQGVYVYVESDERNFAKLTMVIENQLMAVLAKKGCSFVLSPLQADFQLYIIAATRRHSDYEGFVTCYANVRVNLVDTRKKKSVFKDEFSQKGVASTKENAGRLALEDAVPVIANKISSWIEN